MSLKHTLRALLEEGQLEVIAHRATERRRILPTLVALTFDRDVQVCWRAIEALGMACSEVSREDPAYVLEQLRRLYWLISEESGGICWRAPECLAEIVSRQPKRFADYLPIAFHLLVTLEEEDLRHFRAGALWSTGRLAAHAGDQIGDVLPAVLAALENPDPQVRGMAVWCLQQAGETARLEGRADLLGDEGPVELYVDRRVVSLTVRQLVERALGAATPPRVAPS